IAGNGDVNGDGHPDILLGSRISDGNGLNCGEAYVLYGHDSSKPFPAVVGVSSLGTPGTTTPGIIINGSIDGGFLGDAVALADINTDGIADVVLGATLAYNFNNDDFTEGFVYVVFGKGGSGISNGFSVASLNGSNGFHLEGFGQFANAGTSVAAA